MTIKDQAAPKKRQIAQNAAIWVGKQIGQPVRLMSMTELKQLAAQGEKQ
ncbi:hypothetical protein [Pseudoalteromonas 'SMAR']